MATRNSAALFNMSYFGKFLLSGPDADQAVEWIFTNKVASNDPGKTVYTCMLNKNAGIEADLTVSVLRGQDEASLISYDIVVLRVPRSLKKTLRGARVSI